MAWNGRNESILGAKPVGGEAPASVAADAPKATSSNISPETKNEAQAKPTAPTPVKSVWNGRHQNITGIRAVSQEAAPTKEASGAVRSSSPAIPSASHDREAKELQVVNSSPMDIKSVQLQPLTSAKEDETTNSTAGSSTTNTTITEEQPALEGKVVTTTVSSDAKNQNKDGKDASSQGRKNSPATNTAPKTVRGSSNGNSNRQGHPAKNATSGGNANGNHPRRAGNSKGGRGNNHGGNNLSGNSNPRHNYVRVNSNNGARRRNGQVNDNNVATEKPVCAFFLRGTCNRGTSCAFRHDPALAPTSVTPPTSNAAPLQRSGSAFGSTKRVYNPYKARAIQLAKEAQDKEDRSRYASAAKIIRSTEEKKLDVAEEGADVEPVFFSIDVECIATGFGSCAKGINDGCGNEGRENEGAPAGQYNDRSHRYPGRVAMVDADGNILVDIVVRPPQDGKGVVSYLTPLTGLTADLCLGPNAKSLEEVVATVKGLLPQNGVLIGQAIDHDAEWLGLVPGKDFERMIDISEIFRQRLPGALNQAAEVLKKKEAEGDDAPTSSWDPSSDEFLGFATRYRHFSLRHVCINLLGEDIQSGVHDPITDARYSLRLFHKYRNSSVTQLRIVRDGLHRAPITPGFAVEHTPVIDGVCVSAAGYPYKRAARKIWRWWNKRSS